MEFEETPAVEDTIILEDIEEKESPINIGFDFDDESLINGMMNDDTEQGEQSEPVNVEIIENLTVEEQRQQIIDEENNEENKMDLEDYETLSSLFIEIVDFLTSFLLMWIAKDKTDVPYTLAEKKKKKLTKLGSKVLIKLSPKFNVTTMFFITLIFAYIIPIKGAIGHRKEVNEEDKKKKEEEKKKKERVQVVTTPVKTTPKPKEQQKITPNTDNKQETSKTTAIQKYNVKTA